MTNPISKRVSSIKPSATLNINEKVLAMKGKGIPVHDLGLGEADYPTPEFVSEELHNVELTNTSRYTQVQGTPKLRRAVADALKTCFHIPQIEGKVIECPNDVNYDSSEIVISVGSKHLLYSTLLALTNPSDEVILQAPFWVSYPDMVKLTGAKQLVVSASAEENFIPPAERIADRITSKTKIVMLNSPNNPTGMVWSKKDIQDLADVILPHEQLYMLSDEIYGLMVYNGTKHFSPSAVSEELRDRTILTSGLSKAYSMGGWRIGFAAIANPSIKDAILKIAANTISSVPSITQDATINVFKSWKRVETMRLDFQERSAVISKRLNGMGLETVVPKGAFYAFPDISPLIGHEINGTPITNSREVSEILLEIAHVASVPGSEFGNDNHIRLSFVQPVEALERACDAIEDLVKNYI